MTSMQQPYIIAWAMQPAACPRYLPAGQHHHHQAGQQLQPAGGGSPHSPPELAACLPACSAPAWPVQQQQHGTHDAIWCITDVMSSASIKAHAYARLPGPHGNNILQKVCYTCRLFSVAVEYMVKGGSGRGAVQQPAHNSGIGLLCRLFVPPPSNTVTTTSGVSTDSWHEPQNFHYTLLHAMPPPLTLTLSCTAAARASRSAALPNRPSCV